VARSIGGASSKIAEIMAVVISAVTSAALADAAAISSSATETMIRMTALLGD
jgi:hypothetical protein